MRRSVAWRRRGDDDGGGWEEDEEEDDMSKRIKSPYPSVTTRATLCRAPGDDAAGGVVGVLVPPPAAAVAAARAVGVDGHAPATPMYSIAATPNGSNTGEVGGDVEWGRGATAEDVVTINGGAEGAGSGERGRSKGCPIKAPSGP